MKLDESVHLSVCGGGRSGVAFIKELRKYNGQVQITLIDKQKYFFDKKDLCSLLVKKDTHEVINLEDFSCEHNVTFVHDEIERINFNKKIVYFKKRDSLHTDILIFSCGLTSRKLSIKGDSREGFFYFSDIDVFLVRDYLSYVQDVVIFASTSLGLLLAFSLSFLGKEIKLLTGECVFLGGQKERILSLLRQRGIDIYENHTIAEVVGERMVKAVKTSVPKVFSSHLVCVDSGFLPASKMLDFIPESENFRTPYSGIYIMGDVRTPSIEDECLFLYNSSNTQAEGEHLARYLLGYKEECIQRKCPSPEDVESFLASEFREEKVFELP